MNETVERIQDVFRNSLGIAVPSPATDLVEAGALDSLGLVTLLYELEREFSITIPLDLDVASLRTVERLAELVDRARGSEATAQ